VDRTAVRQRALRILRCALPWLRAELTLIGRNSMVSAESVWVRSLEPHAVDGAGWQRLRRNPVQLTPSRHGLSTIANGERSSNRVTEGCSRTRFSWCLLHEPGEKMSHGAYLNVVLECAQQVNQASVRGKSERSTIELGYAWLYVIALRVGEIECCKT
jgi:hypothetical protein